MKKRCFIIVGRHSTWVVLNYLNDHEYTEYSDLLVYATPYSLNRIIKELLDSGLIRYYCDAEMGANHLVLTEGGKRILEACQELREVIQKSEGR